jgi:hypothetical protein
MKLLFIQCHLVILKYMRLPRSFISVIDERKPQEEPRTDTSAATMTRTPFSTLKMLLQSRRPVSHFHDQRADSVEATRRTYATAHGSSKQRLRDSACSPSCQPIANTHKPPTPSPPHCTPSPSPPRHNPTTQRVIQHQLHTNTHNSRARNPEPTRQQRHQQHTTNKQTNNRVKRENHMPHARLNHKPSQTPPLQQASSGLRLQPARNHDDLTRAIRPCIHQPATTTTTNSK